MYTQGQKKNYLDNWTNILQKETWKYSKIV